MLFESHCFNAMLNVQDTVFLRKQKLANARLTLTGPLSHQACCRTKNLKQSSDKAILIL